MFGPQPYEAREMEMVRSNRVMVCAPIHTPREIFPPPPPNECQTMVTHDAIEKWNGL